MSGAPGSPVPYTDNPVWIPVSLRLSHRRACNPILHARDVWAHRQAEVGLATNVNPTLGVIRYIYWNGSSNYNGLNVNLDKKFSHDLQFQVAYTFSKSLDDTSQTIAGDTFGNGINSPTGGSCRRRSAAHPTSTSRTRSPSTPCTRSQRQNRGVGP